MDDAVYLWRYQGELKPGAGRAEMGEPVENRGPVYRAILHPSADIRSRPSADAKLVFRTTQSISMAGRFVPDTDHGDKRVWFEVALDRGAVGYIHQMFLKSASEDQGGATANGIVATIKRERRQARELRLFAIGAFGLLAAFSLLAWYISGR